MRNTLRATALALAAALVLMGLGACGGNSGAGAMGRYVEDALAQGVSITGAAAGLKDGALSWFGEADGVPVRFTLADGTPQAQPLAFAEELLAQGGSISSLSEAQNGTIYGIYTDKEGKASVLRCADGQAAALIAMENWTTLNNRMGNGENQRVSMNNVQGEGEAPPQGAAPEGGAPPEGDGPSMSVSNGGAAVDPTKQMIPQSLVALEDGFLVSYMMQGVYQYDSAGAQVRSFEATVKSFVGFSDSSGLAVFGDAMAWVDSQAGEVLLFDLNSGEQTGKAAYEGLNGTTFLSMDAEGPLVADSSGISRWDGKEWKLLVDGSMTSLVMPNQTVTALVCDGDEWYAFLTATESTQLLRFRYDPELPAQPEKELTIFSLYDNETVRLAIGEFQRANPEVRVTLEVGIEEKADENQMGIARRGSAEAEAAPQPDNSATVDDVLRALNTRLVAKDGPDLIVLDGLPLQSYIEKGVLKDISELAERLTGEEDLLENLAGAYQFDGKTYALPSRFSVPVMIGDSGSLDGIDSIAALAAAVEAYEGEEAALLKAPDQLWESSGLLMYGYDASVAQFTKADGSIDEAALTAYLGDALTLTQVLRERNPQANEGQERRVAIAMGLGGAARQVDSGVINIAEGEALIHLLVIDSSMDYAMIANQLGGMEGMTIESLFRKGYFMPVGGVGVSAAGKQQELAEAFLQTLLGKTVQENYMAGALPVNRAAWAVMTAALEEQFSQLEGAQFKDMGFLGLCEALRTPLLVDDYVKNAVSTRAKSVVDGTLAPAEAAAKVVADTRLYLAE